MEKDPLKIAKKMYAIDAWKLLAPANWIIKPLGTVIPYFCTAIKFDGKSIKWRLLFLEGWQTFHDFMRARIDPESTIYSSPMEMPHYEALVEENGKFGFFRYDSGYVPRLLEKSERELLAKLMWEAYGVAMRIESNPNLSSLFAKENSMFARVETSPGEWVDSPMPIPAPRPMVDEIAFPTSDIKKAKDLPFKEKQWIEMDFRLVSNLRTKGSRPRFGYVFIVAEGESKKGLLRFVTSVDKDETLKDLWQGLPAQLLKLFLNIGYVPGELKMVSRRLFRMMRPFGSEFPLKISVVESLPEIDRRFEYEATH